MKSKHLIFSDRLEIKKYLMEGKSCYYIATQLNRNRSTIHYEIKNKSKNGEYNPEYAQLITDLNRKNANSLRAKYANQKLVDEIIFQLKRKRSPKHIATYLRKKFPDNKKMWVSHETIYKIIFSFKNNKTFANLANLYTLLPRKNKKKHIRGHLNPYRAYKRYWRSIHRMSEKLKNTSGVWQIDAMHIKNGYLLVCVEVVSKKVMAMPLEHLTAEACLQALKKMFSRVETIKAIICDRGSENTLFKQMQRILNTRVYACDPGSPWQKGLVEGTIKLLRQHFPNNYKYKSLNVKRVYKTCALLNTMYRVSLGKETANKVYYRSNLTLT